MRTSFGLILGVLLLNLLVLDLTRGQKTESTGPVGYGDGPGRNLTSNAKGIPDDWSVAKGATKNVLWQAPLGGKAYGGPVVAEGKVFVGTNNDRPRDPSIKGDRGILACYDAKTGAFLWQIVHEKLDSTIDAEHCGIASTPIVENGKVYYVSNRCELVCAETTKGKILWSLDMIGELKVYPGSIPGGLANSSPLILGDLVYAGTSNGVEADTKKPKEPKAPSLIAVNKNTGKLAWQDASPGNDILDGQWSSPAAAKIDGKWQVVYAGGDGWLRGYEAETGKVLWKFDCNPKGLVFNPNRRDSKNYVIATPVVHDNKVYVAVGVEPEAGNGIGHLWCVDPSKKPANKDLDLTPAENDFDPKSPKNKDSGLVWHHGGEILPKPKGNERQYHFGRTMSTVAIHNGLVFAAERNGYLQCLDAATGKKHWEYDLKDGTWSSPYHADGKVFIGTESGELFIFEASKDLKEPKKIDMEHEQATPPVAVDNVLYISNGLYLFAIQGK